jgi:hypothetical protein
MTGMFEIMWQMASTNLNTLFRQLRHNYTSSLTEEHGALRHILCRGPFSATFGPLLKKFFDELPPPSPKKFSVSVPFWESKNFSGHTPIFPKDKKFFPETPTMFIATVDVYLL